MRFRRVCSPKPFFFGPTPYLSAADSPFDLSGLGSTFWLEDFEDGELNTPGVTADPSSYDIQPAGELTDSVDGDDGQIDGFGRNGHSVRNTTTSCTPEFCSGGFAFTFDPSALGRYPTAVGIDWTVGLPVDDRVGISAYAADGTFLGGFVVESFADDNQGGGTGEDRYFGIASSVGFAEFHLEPGVFPASLKRTICSMEPLCLSQEPAHSR